MLSPERAGELFARLNVPGSSQSQSEPREWLIEFFDFRPFFFLEEMQGNCKVIAAVGWTRLSFFIDMYPPFRIFQHTHTFTKFGIYVVGVRRHKFVSGKSNVAET